MRYFLFLFVLLTNLSCVSVSGSTDPSQKGRHNKLVSVLRPMLPERLKGAYYHTLYDETRGAGDCQPYCPQVDIWQYQYLDHVSSAPISTQKAFWKSPDEARVISFFSFWKESNLLPRPARFPQKLSNTQTRQSYYRPCLGFRYFYRSCVRT